MYSLQRLLTVHRYFRAFEEDDLWSTSRLTCSYKQQKDGFKKEGAECWKQEVAQPEEKTARL